MLIFFRTDMGEPSEEPIVLKEPKLDTKIPSNIPYLKDDNIQIFFKLLSYND